MANSSIPMFAIASYGKIQTYIDEKILKYPSYVFCKDKNTMVFIDKDLHIQEIKGFDQSSIISVDVLPEENIQKNTFYICNGKGHLLINDVLVPVFKELNETGESGSDYDLLEHIPIANKYGEISSPIIISDLENGSYSIKGQYKIGGDNETVYVSSKDVIMLVESDDEYKYITRLGAKGIYQYTLDLDTNKVTINEYATQSWILAQGYTTENYVDKAIENLYNRIAEEALVTITKLSQLENDMGYLTESDMTEIDEQEIVGLF